MRRKDGIELKFKWRRILSHKQCFYDFKYMPDRFTWYAEEIGTVIMWIALILCSPIIAIWCILDFPRKVIRFLHTAKTEPKEKILNNKHFDYFCEITNKGEIEND